MSDKHNELPTRDVLYNSERVKTYEERLGRHILDVPLREVFSKDSGLVADKVAATVLEGAYDEAGFWPDLVRIEQMGNQEKLEIPIITMRDFRRTKGYVDTASKQFAGGQATKISLDISKESKNYYMTVGFRKQDIELQKWNMIEQGLRLAGAKFAKETLNQITKAYVDDAGTDRALGASNRFKELTLLEADLADLGFTPDICIMNAKDFADCLVEAVSNAFPFLTAVGGPTLGIGDFERGIGRQGLVAQLFGRIPVYRVNNDADLLSDLVLAQRNAGEVVGMSKEMTVVDFGPDPFKGLQGFVLEARYDLVKGIANAIGKVSGA